MLGWITCLTVLLLATTGHASIRAVAASQGQVATLSIDQLEHQLRAVDSELDRLANYSLRSGVGSIGYRSPRSSTATVQNEWVQINLEETCSIDQIVLVPSIWRDAENGFRAIGFPLAFRILAGDGQRTNVVATFDAEDDLLPRIAPLVVDAGSINASWVRVDVLQKTPIAFNRAHCIELSELMVFDGQENVALRKPVSASSIPRKEIGARKREYLVDGQVPYIMDAAKGEPSFAFVSEVGAGERPELRIDLGSVLPLNRIHLHAVDLTDSVPQSTPSGFGVPRQFVVEGATKPDFSDAIQLVDYETGSIYDVGPIIMRRFSETPCRYVRLTAIKPYIHTDEEQSGTRIGFAELELFSRGQNVALGKRASANFSLESRYRSFAALTDGCNLYGRILPVRDWLNQLARRHDLESQRPILAAELSKRYAGQRARLTQMTWLVMLLVIVVVLSITVERLLHVRHLSRIRERYAADLHDELGANVHTIGLLGDVALSSLEDPERLKRTLMQSRDLTERTGTAVRHCMDMQELHDRPGGIRHDIERVSRRILADFRYDISITGREFLDSLKPRKRSGVLLFYKECLVNISRHSDAEQVQTQLDANRKRVVLTVHDDGRGLPCGRENTVPHSLKRRAKLMGARVDVESAAGKGTCVKLTVRTRRFWPAWTEA